MSVPSRKHVKALHKRAELKTQKAVRTQNKWGMGMADEYHREAARAWAEFAWVWAVRFIFFGKIVVALAVLTLLLAIIF